MRDMQLVAKTFLPYSLVLCAISILLPIKVNNLAIIILMVNWLVLPDLPGRIKKALQNKWMILFFAFFGLHLVSLAYTTDMREGLSFLERRSAFFIFPLIIGGLEISSEQYNKVLKGFLWGYFLISTVLVTNSLFVYLKTADIGAFFYQDFMTLISIHPIYYAMYGIFCLAIFLSQYIKGFEKMNLTSQALRIAGGGYLLLIIILCASKMMIFVSLGYMFVHLMYAGMMKADKKFVIGSIAALSMLIYFSFTFDFVKERFNEINDTQWSVLSKGRLSEVNERRDPEKHITIADKFDGLNLRVLLWKIGVESLYIDNHLVAGVAPGDATAYLNKNYTEYNLHRRKLLNYVSHNEYVSTLVEFGLIGLILFLTILVVSLIIAWRNRNIIYLTFLMTFIFGCITESMLHLNKGIIFFCFFSTLFIVYHKDLKLKNAAV